MLRVRGSERRLAWLVGRVLPATDATEVCGGWRVTTIVPRSGERERWRKRGGGEFDGVRSSSTTRGLRKVLDPLDTWVLRSQSTSVMR
jgi:hypothetical protein